MFKSKALTHQRLKEALRFDLKTSEFTWIKPAQKSRIGTKAGNCQADGSILITIDGKTYRGHHLAFLYVTGEIPAHIEHKDGNKANNAVKNLAAVVEGKRSGRACYAS
jgi:HNH endonuclease